MSITEVARMGTVATATTRGRHGEAVPVRPGDASPGGRRRRSARGLGPTSRPAPVGSAAGARTAAGHRSRAQACRPGRGRPPIWRLTERGVAVIVATALLIAVAAVAVVASTALRVTGGDQRPVSAVSRY